jgi:hypothetical protein
MEIADIFDAKPYSAWKVLCEPGQGLYIPAYQRSYAWAKEHIERLFDDTATGMLHLLNTKDAITFIGTLIAIHDTRHETVQPQVQGDLPSRVMLIIDGQQRLTTLLIINTILCEEILMLSHHFSEKSEEAFLWIHNESLKIASELKATFQMDMTYGEGSYQYYPRMIRAYEDSWSRKTSLAKYNSSIATYLHGFIKHWAEENQSQVYKPFDGQDVDGSNKVLLNNHKSARQLVRKAVCLNSHPDIIFPDPEDIIRKGDFQRILLNAPIPDFVAAYLTSSDESAQKKRFDKLFRVIMFSRFFAHRMAVTVVTAKNEDYAFDMFESLNTTGEPLTAFETFKPKVIQSEGLSSYEDSKARQYIEQIEAHLDSFKKAQDKQKATTELLIPFALAETGDKLSKRLSDQRRYLRDSYDSIESSETKLSFVKNLAHTSNFMKDAWPTSTEQDPNLIGIPEEEEKTLLMCLDFLRRCGHTISIAPVVRYYAPFMDAKSDQQMHTLHELVAVVKAIAAFFFLWRSAHRGTAGIDSEYRRVMRSGFASIPALSRRSHSGSIHPLLSAEQVIEVFRNILSEQGNIKSLSDWKHKSSDLPLYTMSDPLARFYLLAASHDTVSDLDEYGLVKEGRPGVLDIFNFHGWKIARHMEIEHIAPQARSSTWGDKLYEKQDTIHRIGNLALVPKIENIVLGNRSWADKKLIYKILSASTLSDVEALLGEAQSIGLDLTDRAQEIFKVSKYLPHVEALQRYEGDWDLDIIAKRGNRLAEISWSRISPWLGL